MEKYCPLAGETCKGADCILMFDGKCAYLEHWAGTHKNRLAVAEKAKRFVESCALLKQITEVKLVEDIISFVTKYHSSDEGDMANSSLLEAFWLQTFGFNRIQFPFELNHKLLRAQKIVFDKLRLLDEQRHSEERQRLYSEQIGTVRDMVPQLRVWAIQEGIPSRPTYKKLNDTDMSRYFSSTGTRLAHGLDKVLKDETNKLL